MVRGYHIIFSAYGFWLPNDPRGSWSDFVGSWELFHEAGHATKTDERRSVARRPHDRETRLKAKEALSRPAVTFNGIQARAIGRGFAEYVAKSELPVWACSILPEHVHLVTGPLPMSVEQLIIQLKGAATERLIEEQLHPFSHLAQPGERTPKCWTRGEWKVFLFEDEDVARAIRYVENNPIKDGKSAQTWSFVTSPFNRDAESSERSACQPRSAPKTPRRG